MKLREKIIHTRHQTSAYMLRVGLFFAMILPLFASAPRAAASATNIYISQNGSGTGTSCSDTFSAAWFNNSANWGSGTNQIGPGTTVHLCGTFTGAAGANGLTVQGSGSSGNPITILFESGASMQAPYWGTNDGSNPTGGAIVIGSHSYITVDGQNVGIIENTLNGDPTETCLGGTCSYQDGTNGVYINGGTYDTIENVSIIDMYMRTPCGSNVTRTGGQVDDVYIAGNASHVTITGNTMHDAGTPITDNGSTTSYITISNNILSRAAIEITFAASGTGQNYSHVYIFGNEGFDNYVGWDPADANHLNFLHMWTLSGATSSDVNVYNNYIHGDFGGVTCGGGGSHTTSYLYFEGMNGVNVFNNLFVANPSDVPSNGMIGTLNGDSNFLVVNNTMWGPTTPSNYGTRTSPSETFENNIVEGTAIYIGETSSGDLAASDYNDFYNGGSQPFQVVSTYDSLNSWQNLGFDVHSSTSNPNLDASFVPSSGSPIIGVGKNLYSICNGQPTPGLGALCYDKAGNSRPSISNWDIGAYQYNLSSGNQPAAPINLSAVIN